MGYVEESLLPGETVRWRTRLHWSVYIWPGLFAASPIVLPLIKAVFFWRMVRLGAPELFIIGIPFSLFVGLPWLVLVTIRVRTTEFAVTDKRILAKVGVVSRSTVELYLPKVESVQVSQGVLGRALDFGTVTFCGTGGSHNRFRRVVAPLAFRRAVQALMTGEPVPEPPPTAPRRPTTPRGPLCPTCKVPVPPARPICPKCGQRVRLSRPA